MKDTFNTGLADSQATPVAPVAPERFDTARYADYAAALEERCADFWAADEGVLVYRRMRVKEVFAEDCKDMKRSLEWQLGTLEASMRFEADIPNFLEPWYGLGTVAAAYGFDYRWEEGLAPAVDGKFGSTAELVAAPSRGRDGHRATYVGYDRILSGEDARCGSDVLLRCAVAAQYAEQHHRLQPVLFRLLPRPRIHDRSHGTHGRPAGRLPRRNQGHGRMVPPKRSVRWRRVCSMRAAMWVRCCRRCVATMTSVAGFAGSVGGVLAALLVGNVLEQTDSYYAVFMMAGFAYLAAWLCLQIFLSERLAE